jgi:hypothetical protein
MCNNPIHMNRPAIASAVAMLHLVLASYLFATGIQRLYSSGFSISFGGSMPLWLEYYDVFILYSGPFLTGSWYCVFARFFWVGRRDVVPLMLLFSAITPSFTLFTLAGLGSYVILDDDWAVRLVASLSILTCLSLPNVRRFLGLTRLRYYFWPA